MFKLLKFSIFIFLIALYGCQENFVVSKYKIGFAQCCNDPWRDVMNSEMARELAFHPEIKLEMLVSGNNSEKQMGQIRELVKQKVDLLIVSPNETKPLTPIIEEVYKAGIPVILIDRKTESELYTAFIGADNYEIGQTAAKYIANQIKGTANIIELKLQMTISPATERNRGFRDAVNASNRLKIIDSIEAVKGLDDIVNQLPDILRQHPEANVIFGHTDLLAEIAYKIAREQGREKDIFFVGIDGIPGTGRGIQAVEDGVLKASLLYPTGGAEAIRLALSILNKESFNKQNTLQTIVINSDNANILHNQMKKVNSLQESMERQTTKLEELNRTYSTQKSRLYFVGILLSIVILLSSILLYLFKEKQHSNERLAVQNQAILEQKNKIEEVSEQARQATEEKLRFYSYISHEFRTPLSLILTPTEDLLHNKTTDARETRSTLQLVRKNANRLLCLVDQLLELRQIDAGKMTLEAHQADLVAFIKDIVNDFSVKAKSQSIDLQFICPFSALPFWIDAEKLDKVLFNIISNAFKYTPQGGLIHVSLLKNLDKIEIVVTDNGIGMTAEEREHAFDLFYRGSQNMSLGSGLGLALSHEFVLLHKGEIRLESEKGHGTTFKVVLPFNQSDSIAEFTFETDNTPHFKHYIETQDVASNLPNTPPQYFENTIVLIEDNIELNAFLSQKLSKNYNIVAHETAERGWEAILEHIPDLIISDVMLPGMDGFTLTQKVKNDFRTSHIPVILLTAKGQMESQITGAKAGADAYMPKPFNQHLLEERVKGLIENRDRMRRRFTNEITNPSSVLKGERKFLIEFEALIEKNLADSTLSVEKLSHELGMSRVQLFRKISALTNKNVSDYIADFKLQKAKALLTNSDKTIAEIAYETGFNNPSYFTTFFKQKTNQTPTEWRNG